MPPTHGPTNNDIEETVFLRFADTVIRHAADWLKDETLPTAYQRQFQFVNSREYYQPIVAVPNYRSWLEGHLEEITTFPETQACIRQLWIGGTLRYLLPKSQWATLSDQLTDEQVHILVGFVFYALVDLLQRPNTVEPTREHILDTFSRFRTGWTATTHRHVAIIPLLNFHTTIQQPFQLSPHYKLSSFTGQEKAWVWGVMDDFHESRLIPFFTFMQTEFKLMGEWFWPDLNRVDDQQKALQEHSASDVDLLHNLRNIVTALRLIKPGDVAVIGYADQSDEVPPFGGYAGLRALSGLWSDFQIRDFGSSYILEASDTREVQFFAEALGLLDSRPSRAGLEIALRRFNQSYSREYYEDRLIDLTIALESTLLADVPDPKTDLRYRFVLHGAALLAERQRPQEVHNFLRAMYDARSAIVHSGKTLSDMKKKDMLGYEWKVFVQACEDMTRDVLAEYVRQLQHHRGSTVKSITNGLEAQLVRGLELTSKVETRSEPNDG